MKPSKEQEKLIAKAGLLIKEAFPNQNLQFNFNLACNRDHINYNMEGKWKISGILDPRKL